MKVCEYKCRTIFVATRGCSDGSIALYLNVTSPGNTSNYVERTSWPPDDVVSPDRTWLGFGRQIHNTFADKVQRQIQRLVRRGKKQ